MTNDFQPPLGVAGSFFEEMVMVKEGRSKRASSWDRSGGNGDCILLDAGETYTLADIAGAGSIRHIYFTADGVDRFFMRKAVLRMYWDGEESPSVEVPFGDFFGLGFCEPRYYKSLLVTVNPGVPSPGGTLGLNSYFLMPFSERALITIENDGETPMGVLWYHIDYDEYPSLPPGAARFHAQWRRENPTTGVQLPGGKNVDGKENYVILEATGRGNYVGMFLNIDNLASGWYGEGDDMIFIDGDKWPPSMHGTGTEEIFGGGAGPNEEYAGPYTGYHLISNKDYSGKQSMYRFHVTDPIRFSESIRVTIEHGHANDLSNDYSSTAFWYQFEPHGRFPELPPREQRVPRHSEGMAGLYARELAAYSRLAHCGGVLGFLESLSADERVVFADTRAASKNVVETNDFQGALKTLQRFEELLSKHGR